LPPGQLISTKNMNKKIRIHAPATVANLVCGFDVLGLALQEPYDVMELELLPTPVVQIEHEDAFGLPTAAEKNVAGVVLLAMVEAMENSCGFRLTINKQIRPGSGLGSSAASAAGAAAAANKLLDDRFTLPELVQFAMLGEKLATGVKHADNIAPALYGGVTLIRSIHPLDIVRIDPPALHVSVVHPQIEVRTSDARQILKKQILLKDAIKQWGNVAGLVAGFLQKDYALIGRSLEDVLIEPVRSMLIPGFDTLKKNCLAAGALGGGISGSGPSVFMLSENEATAKAVTNEMDNLYQGLGITAYSYTTTINKEGVYYEEI
jgi:homoserine kinase